MTTRPERWLALPQGENLRQAAQAMLAAVFLFSGITKAFMPDQAVAEFAALGLPVPEVVVAAVALFQLGAGALLLFGLWVVPAALALAGFTLAATLIGHPFWRGDATTMIHEATAALEHLAIVGGLIAIIGMHSRRRQSHADP